MRSADHRAILAKTIQDYFAPAWFLLDLLFAPLRSFMFFLWSRDPVFRKERADMEDLNKHMQELHRQILREADRRPGRRGAQDSPEASPSAKEQ